MTSTIFGIAVPSSVIAQLASKESGSGPPDGITIAKWRGRRFVSSDGIVGKGSRGRSSWIRDHGIFVTELVGEEDTPGKPLI